MRRLGPEAEDSVYSVNENGSEGGEALVASPDVDVVSFTGSSATGKRIMATAAATLKRLSLELGGKAPAVCLAAGGVLKGATGAGAPMLAVPAMAAFFDVRFAVIVMLVPNLFTNGLQSVAFPKSSCRKQG